jgi:hypothetical protein
MTAAGPRSMVNYPRFKKEWQAYKETYHSVVNDDKAAKTPEGEVREGRCVENGGTPRRSAGDMGYSGHLL